MTKKEKLNFKESCEFYCNYHKVGNLEMTMICGNLGIVVDRLLKSQRKEIVEKIEKGGYIIGKREGDAFKEEDTKEFINLIK